MNFRIDPIWSALKNQHLANHFALDYSSNADAKYQSECVHRSHRSVTFPPAHETRAMVAAERWGHHNNSAPHGHTTPTVNFKSSQPNNYFSSLQMRALTTSGASSKKEMYSWKRNTSSCLFSTVHLLLCVTFKALTGPLWIPPCSFLCVLGPKRVCVLQNIFLSSGFEGISFETLWN